MDASNPSFALEIATAISFLLFAGGFWAVSSLGQWAIAPVERLAVASRPARIRTQFSLGEFLLLLVQVQFSAGLCVAMVAKDRGWALLACALVVGGVAAMWWVSLRRLAICKIVCRWPRAVFLGIVAPLTCAAIVAGLWFNGRAVFEIAVTGDFLTMPWLTGNFAALTAFLICRRLTLWVLRDVTMVEAPAPALAECRS